MKDNLRKLLPDAVVVVLFLVVSFAYFITPVSQGLVLGGHDSVASIGLGREQQEYVARTGEMTRWTNSVFSGMPTYQIAPSYGSSSLLSTLWHVYGLGTEGAVCYVFLYLLGFYILMRAFSFKPWLSALGAVLWAFSSYFFIIISAGHIWKVMTLALIPPTIAGMVLCYRGRLLWGGAVTALFTAFQILSNHVQMSYYFLFVMFFMVLAYGIEALRRKTVRSYLRATGVIVLAGLLGLAANLPNLYHTYEYSKASMRGKAELTPLPVRDGRQAEATDGLDRDYITAWSYGVDETLTLMIPNFKGGGSSSLLDKEGVEAMDGYAQFYDCAAQTQQLLMQSGQQATPPGLMLYWGNQPFTVGPVYVGAFVCFLFVLGLFLVRGPLKWALAASTVVSLLFAWGHNSPDITDFLIDHLPMYSKFRTVSSALVIAEFTLPLLAMLCLARLLREPELFRTKRIAVGVSLALTAGVCLLLWMFPGMAGDCLSANDEAMFGAMSGALPSDFIATYRNSITQIHHAILSQDALRSLMIILAGVLLLWLYSARRIQGWLLCTALAVISLTDMWQVNKRYLNDSSFSDPVAQIDNLGKTPADKEILKDKSYYRVVNLGGGNPFNETSNQTSYWHKSIGGYHAAKLHRYQDLIDRRLQHELSAFAGAVGAAEGDMTQVNGDSLSPALNMLNTKYFIFGQGERAQAVLNPYANGNGWFVRKLDFVDSPDKEMAALGGLDTKHAAVADEKFRSVLDGSPLGDGTVRLTKYEPNELHYDISSSTGGVVVFSEIYYPGWTVTVDGTPVEAGRVDYVLRAVKVPAGNHKVVMEFRPGSVSLTETVAYAAIFLVLAVFLFALWRVVRKEKA